MAAQPSFRDRVHTGLVEELRAAGCVFAEAEADVLTAEADSSEELAEFVRRRTAGLPLEQVLGWAEFCGLRIIVEPGVFVPRHRTELLARCAAEGLAPGDVVVDLCCGSGAVGGRVYAGDLCAPLPASIAGCVDVLVANAPYVPTAAVAFLPSEARSYEPRIALDGGGDGLDVHRRLADAAPGWLAPSGRLLMEIGESQADAAIAVFGAAGLAATVRTSEVYDATVVVGTRP